MHPVIRSLPQQHHVYVEKGLLKTFGRVMPVLMSLCVLLSVSYAFEINKLSDTAQMFSWASACSFIAALIFTIVFNVPINLATGKWSAENPPDNWKEKRNRWEFFQGLRSWLLLIGFVLLCVAVTLHDDV
ncbi:MAG: DUF1772 domain-containing protein [Bacteroidota bacterium]|nr:DUF1772 domain-containing protein [Bacteroidota bacterium]